MAYEYKVVPFMGKKKTAESVDEVSRQLQALIVQHATSGWEFFQLADVKIEEKPGCIAGLFGATIAYTYFNQLIFRKSI